MPATVISISPCGDVITAHITLNSLQQQKSERSQVSNLNCYLLRIVGSTLSLVGSGERSIVAARNGSQFVDVCNPLLKIVLSV